MNESNININKLKRLNAINFIIGLASNLFRFLFLITLVANLIALTLTKDDDKKQIYKSGIIGCVIGFLITFLIIFISSLTR